MKCCWCWFFALNLRPKVPTFEDLMEIKCMSIILKQYICRTWKLLLLYEQKCCFNTVKCSNRSLLNLIPVDVKPYDFLIKFGNILKVSIIYEGNLKRFSWLRYSLCSPWVKTCSTVIALRHRFCPPFTGFINIKSNSGLALRLKLLFKTWFT